MWLEGHTGKVWLRVDAGVSILRHLLRDLEIRGHGHLPERVV